MSKLIVEVCTVGKIEAHPYADRMKIATIKGWKTAIPYDPTTGKAQFEEGEKCIYFPPDSVLPPALAHGPSDPVPGRLNILKYLGALNKDEVTGERPAGGRVRAAVLRGVPSYGFIMKIDPSFGDDPEWPVGTDVADHYGITKWEPPPKPIECDSEVPHPLLHSYIDIQHYGNFPNEILPEEEVVITEKIHGKNCRLGMVKDDEWMWVVGSNSERRKEFLPDGKRSPFWEVLTEPIKEMILYIKDSFPYPEDKVGIIVFGELFGSGVQDISYGFRDGNFSFRAFDIAINGKYLNYHDKVELCNKFSVPMAPVLYVGPFSVEKLEELTSGPTTMCESSKAGKFKGREGVVVVPTTEKFSIPLMVAAKSGRVILKSVSAEYLQRSGGTEDH